jgi:NADH-quinone oxidoreductase subunit L
MGNLVEWLRMFPLRERALFEQTLCLIPLIPFAGFLINGLFGRQMDRRAVRGVAVGAAFASFVWALISVLSLDLPAAGPDIRNALHAVYGEWLRVGDVSIAFGFFLDRLSAVMILVVTGVGAVIHLYSAGYMAHDEGLARYFAYLNLFLAMMCVLVLGDNLLILFIGWEGVGLCSYLLIGFWYEDPAKAAAGMKAFIVNRIGDLGFILGIFALLAIFGTVSFVAKPERVAGGKVTKQTHLLPATDANSMGSVVLPKKPGLLDYGEAIRLLSNGKPSDSALCVGDKTPPQMGNFDLSRTLAPRLWPGLALSVVLTFACVLLFIGAMGKSAQIPLYVWLPDAMAGPTPVSALIHAATMVTAGVYMVCRLHGLYAVSDEAMRMVAMLGGATALVAALIGLAQVDIKKVLAYSTVSQLGYMFLGLGAGAFSLGVFHLLTHAFFKALLFLCAGAVIHELSGEQDMRRMGGLRKAMPVTFWTMVIGALALAGVPPFAGWWSKDAILLSVLERYHQSHDTAFLVLYIAGVVAAFCTAFYIFRLIGLTFLGEPRGSGEKVHEAPAVMTVPLITLAVFSIVAGAWWHGLFTEGAAANLGVRNVAVEASARLHWLNLVLTTVAALGGVAAAWIVYVTRKHVPAIEKAATSRVYRLVFNKFYVDEAYEAFFITPFVRGSKLALWGLEMLGIDFLATGAGYGVRWIAGQLRRIQTGLVNAYAAAILLGAVAVLVYLVLLR